MNLNVISVVSPIHIHIMIFGFETQIATGELLSVPLLAQTGELLLVKTILKNNVANMDFLLFYSHLEDMN